MTDLGVSILMAYCGLLTHSQSKQFSPKCASRFYPIDYTSYEEPGQSLTFPNVLNDLESENMLYVLLRQLESTCFTEARIAMRILATSNSGSGSRPRHKPNDHQIS